MKKLRYRFDESIQNNWRLAIKRLTARTDTWTAREQKGARKGGGHLSALDHPETMDKPIPCNAAIVTTVILTFRSQKSFVLPATKMRTGKAAKASSNTTAAQQQSDSTGPAVRLRKFGRTRKSCTAAQRSGSKKTPKMKSARSRSSPSIPMAESRTAE